MSSNVHIVDYMGHNGGDPQLQHPVRLLLVATCTSRAIRSENEITGVDKHTGANFHAINVTVLSLEPFFVCDGRC
jgi:hypothetical protein